MPETNVTTQPATTASDSAATSSVATTLSSTPNPAPVDVKAPIEAPVDNKVSTTPEVKETPTLLDTADPVKTADADSVSKEAAPDKPAEPAPYDFKMPEGIVIEDEVAFGEFKSEMQKAGVPVEKAPGLVNYIFKSKQALTAGLTQTIQKQVSDNQQKVWNETNAKWQAEVKADPKIGGDKWDTTKKQIALLIAENGTDIPELRQALRYTGAANNPSIIKLLFNISERFKGAHTTFVGNSANDMIPSSATSILYDNKGV